MNRDDILKKSREDNKGIDERETRFRLASAWVARFAFLVGGLALVIAEGAFLETRIISRCLVFLLCCTNLAENLYLFFFLKKKFISFCL